MEPVPGQHLQPEDYYQNEGAFTPKQLVLVFKLMDRHKVKHNPIRFKVKLRRDRERDS